MRPSHRKPLPVCKPSRELRNRGSQTFLGVDRPIVGDDSSDPSVLATRIDPSHADSPQVVPFEVPIAIPASVQSSIQIEIVEEDKRPFELGDLLTRDWMARNSSFMISLAVHTFLFFLMSLVLIHGTGKALIVLDMLTSPDIDERDGIMAEVEVDLDDSDQLVAALNDDPFESTLGFADGDQWLPDLGDVAGKQGNGVVKSGTGDGKSAKFFGMRAMGNKFVYVLDRSGSMAFEATDVSVNYKVNRFDVARVELMNSVESLRPHQEFYVVLFSTDMRRMFGDESLLPQPVKATPENKARLKDWLWRKYAAGGTDPRQSLKLAFQMKPDAIFMLSDGEFHDERADGSPISIDIARKHAAEQSSTQINSIALEDENSKANMEELSEVSGGQFRFIKVADYVATIANSPDEHFRSRAVKSINHDVFNWEKKYDFAVKELIPLLKHRSPMVRTEAEIGLHNLSYGMFYSTIPSVMNKDVDVELLNQAVDTWTEVWTKTNSQTFLDCSTQIGLFSTIAPVGQKDFLETVEAIDVPSLSPLNQIALSRCILSFQDESGVSERSKQLFIDVLRELNKASTAKFGEANFVKRASQATCVARLKKVLRNRHSAARQIFLKWENKKIEEVVRVEHGKDLILLYPETGLAKGVAEKLDVPVAHLNETD